MSRDSNNRYGSPGGKYAPMMLYVVDTDAWRAVEELSHIPVHIALLGVERPQLQQQR